VIKIVALIKRRADLTPEAFSDYYEQSHAPLFQRTIPHDVAAVITRYVQNHAVRLGDGTADAPYDCITEIGFDDMDGMRTWSRWYLGEEGKVLRDDEATFMDTSQRVVIVTDERPIGTAH
jgi:uncharacterized protein (TIGR02118 family)